MNPLQLLTLAIVLHYIADFNLQIGGGLHIMKCKEWWDAQLKDATIKDKEQYKYDYLVALWIHSFVWAAITFAPILWMAGDRLATWLIFAINVFTHGIIDNAKANWKWINLQEDQIFHLGQIALTVLAFTERWLI